MRIAIVEKTIVGRTDIFRKYFDFEYERFGLTTSNKTKILKKDITLQETFDDYDFVILVGKEPAQFIGKIGNLTKYSGQLINDKYIPILNPAAVNFNPGLKDTIEQSIKKLKSHIEGTYEEDLGKYVGIEDTAKALKWIRKAIASPKKVIAVDTETSSLYPRSGYILGISLSYSEGSGAYISTDCIDEEVELELQKLFNSKQVIFHNAKFDIAWLRYHFGFKFSNWHDTMLEHYILNENEPHDLKYLAVKYTSMGLYDEELEVFKKKYCKQHGIKQADFSYELIPFDIIYQYAAADTDATLRLYTLFHPIIEKHFNKLYSEVLLKGSAFLLEMEETGVPFDKDKLGIANIEMGESILDLKMQLYKYPEIKKLEELLGVEFNPNSTAHLRRLLFDLLKLPAKKKTPTGAYSTDKEVLEELAKKHPIPRAILQIRQLVKLRSTYVTKILKGLDNDNRLRTGFHLHTVTSGRLSSSGKLNMQQLPRDNKSIKDAIRSTRPDFRIFSQDLQTAEMYYAAVLSGDKNLAKVFIDGGDFHSSIAKLTFGLTCPVEEIKDKYPAFRQASKAISFGILYGAGPAKVAATAGISFDEAKQIIAQYFRQFNQLELWIKQTREEIVSNGCIYSAFGRKRRVPSVDSVDDYEQGHALRSAMNFTIQSVASDVNLLAAIDAHDMFKKEKIPANIFALVHDSIIGEYHKDVESEVKEILRICTQKDRGVSVPNCPIKVDFKTGWSYAEAA